MTVDPTSINVYVQIAIAFGAAFLVALWLSLIIWTYRDVRGRARDPIIRILAIMVVALLFLPGILIYLILRPARNIEEEYQSTLEEEALLQAIEDTALCPACSRRIQNEWSFCPHCHTRLKKPCSKCGRLMELPWDMCPYCGTGATAMRSGSLSMDDALTKLPSESDE